MNRSGPHTILGISVDHGDAAAAVVIDGRLLNAAQQERFSRVKDDRSIPIDAMRWCLDDAGIGLSDLTHVIVHDKPLGAFERDLASHASAGLRSLPSLSRALGKWSRTRLWAGYRVESALRSIGVESPDVWYAEHHRCLAANAFYRSPFDRAAIVTMDGAGGSATTTIATGSGRLITSVAEQRSPQSVGLLCAAATSFCGLDPDHGGYELMDLAPLGAPRFVEAVYRDLVEVSDDGAFRLNPAFFGRGFDRSAIRSNRWAELFAGPALLVGAEPTQRAADIARSIQVVVEDLIARIAQHASRLTGEQSLCLAGDGAMKWVDTARIQASTGFDRVFRQPAATDGASAIGAALFATHQLLASPRDSGGQHRLRGLLGGPSYRTADVERWLHRSELPFRRLSDDAMAADVAGRIAQGAVVGWFDGAMEFAPWALGCRSVLADPRSAESTEAIGRRLGSGEGFRPLTSAVLAESLEDWFESRTELPLWAEPDTMVEARTTGWKPADAIVGQPFAERLAPADSPLPAVTGLDGTARVHTVGAHANARFRQVLEAFRQLTGCPVLVSTSFNRADEPIVRSPRDAVLAAASARLDVLVIEGHIIEREALVRFADSPGVHPRDALRTDPLGEDARQSSGSSTVEVSTR